jgi:glycosyl hydrolase family 43
MADPVLIVEGHHDDPLGTTPPTRTGRRRLALAVAGALVVMLVGALLVVRRGTDPPTMPDLPVLGAAHDVYDGDLGDPFVLPVTSGATVASFVAFGTGDWPARVPTAHSTDLTTWQEGPDALPQLPAWAGEDPKNSLSWAPAALQTPRGFVLYITLPDAKSGQQCIAAAASPVADGPYTGVGDGPLLCQHELGGSIDPALVRDHDGRLHLLWKNDGNSVGAASSLWEQELAADGLSVAGDAHRLLTASLPWQGGIVEEPAMIPATGGGWWLLYSGNFFDRPEYATGLAFCPTLQGPCRESTGGPFLATPALQQDNQFAPGGLETFHDAHGDLWAVFDTWNRPTRNGRFYCCRSLQLARILSS